MALHWIRNFCLFGLPIFLLVAATLKFGFADFPFADSIYILALTANIGYFTNFIAIKMLFKPYYRTALGRQGLIPKNQPKLAKALSDTLSDHFLASEHWHEYLDNADLTGKLLSSSQAFVDDWLAQTENQQLLADALEEYIENNQQQLQSLFTELQHSLIHDLGETVDGESLIQKSFDWLETQFKEKPREMEFLIEPIVRTLAQNIPLIAQKLHDTIDTHIESQDTIRRGIAKAAKWSANINEDDIKHYLFRMVASFEFRKTLFEGLRSLVNQYRISQPDIQNSAISISDLLDDFIKYQLSEFNIAEYLQRKLKRTNIAEQIVQFLQSTTPDIFTWLNRHLEKPENRLTINQQVIQLIEHIDLREIVEEKAASFSPQKMESIFHNMIKDQLVFIELLGALLGGLSGLALIDMRYFASFAGALLAFYLIDLILTQRNPRVTDKTWS
ncbi:DUF445 family protein [Aliikangiella marina]|uniref:DUF445 family protein n=1 Tax=Aliikangiella marina TaxID=1712262 RepID=A0A545T4W3_9GAMM|nr:DUF445 family protein [Aliikangiella marina]TQV72253.1 DUF445 family protein [Aliikangiella marina]